MLTARLILAGEAYMSCTVYSTVPGYPIADLLHVDVDVDVLTITWDSVAVIVMMIQDDGGVCGALVHEAY